MDPEEEWSPTRGPPYENKEKLGKHDSQRIRRYKGDNRQEEKEDWLVEEVLSLAGKQLRRIMSSRGRKDWD